MYSRLKRLALPFWFWGVVYWIGMVVFCHHFSVRLLLAQLVYGYAVAQHLWFYFTLSVLTALVYFIYRYGHGRALVILLLFAACALVFQHSNANWLLINNIPEHLLTTRVPLGRIMELFPAAVMGALIAAFERKKANRKSLLLMAAGFFAVSAVIWFVSPEPKGFCYQGVVTLFFSASITVAFIVIGHVMGKYGWAPLAVKNMASLMMGVYCVHWAVGVMFARIMHLPHGYPLMAFTFTGSVFVCWVLSRFKVLRPFVC